MSLTPAPPILASSLLSLEREREEGDDRKVPAAKEYWKTGIKTVDEELPRGFWSGGIVGISEEVDEDQEGNGAENGGGKLALQILAKHLLSSQPSPSTLLPPIPPPPADAAAAPPPSLSPAPKAFIITSAISTTTNTNNAFTPSNILQSFINFSASSSSSSISPSTAHPNSLTPYLDSISLLRYFDLPGLIECVSEVSSTLHHHHHLHHHQTTTTTTTTSSDNPPNKTLLIINTLPSTLSHFSSTSTSPASQNTNLNGILSSLLRQLTHLCSSRRSSVLILLTTTTTTAAANMNRIGNVRAGVPVSAFAADGGGVMGLTDLTRQGGGAMVTTERILLDAVPRWVLVHSPAQMVAEKQHGRGMERKRVVVEVVKDDGGSEDEGQPGLGCWAVWDRS